MDNYKIFVKQYVENECIRRQEYSEVCKSIYERLLNGSYRWGISSDALQSAHDRMIGAVASQVAVSEVLGHVLDILR